MAKCIICYGFDVDFFSNIVKVTKFALMQIVRKWLKSFSGLCYLSLRRQQTVSFDLMNHEQRYSNRYCGFH